MRYKFWKDNRLDQEYSLTEDEIKNKFEDYLDTKPLEWIDHFGNSAICANFISSPEGLNSVSENHDVLAVKLHPTRIEYRRRRVRRESGELSAYCLFGEQASRAYYEEGIEGVTPDMDGAICEIKLMGDDFLENVLSAYDGWMGYAQITKDDFNELLTKGFQVV